MRRTSLRVGVLGIGHWHALWHVAALQKMNATTVGVWDHNPRRAQELGREIGCAAYSEVEDALVDGSLPTWRS